ncbi:MAG: YcaO-like family protein [Syntrophales bacterium]|nr:YcaO-like family protein [Syntrophales bacterium]
MINLRPCPKAYLRETHRAKTPEETLAFVDTIKDTLAMIDMKNITDLDRIGIPVFSCFRIRRDNSTTFHTGKGTTNVQAQVSLTMEAVERFSSEYDPSKEGRLIKGSWKELKKKFNILHPTELILSQFADYDENHEISWVEGFDLINSENILVPACAVFHPFENSETFLLSTHTNGIASGNTMEEAILHGVFEVIERDAISIVKFSRNKREQVIIGDEQENEFLQNLHKHFHKAQLELTLYNYTSDLGIPVLAARIEDQIYSDLMPTEGYGAHLDPKVAAARAILEAASSRALLIQRYGLENLRETPIPYLEPEMYLENEEFITLSEMNSGYSLDIKEDIETVLDGIKSAGFTKAIVVDLTSPEIGIPVVRVIIPGMEVFSFDRSRRGQRLYR